MRTDKVIASCAVLVVAALAGGCGPEKYKNDKTPDQNVNQMLEGMKQGPGAKTPQGAPAGGTTAPGAPK